MSSERYQWFVSFRSSGNSRHREFKFDTIEDLMKCAEEVQPLVQTRTKFRFAFFIQKEVSRILGKVLMGGRFTLLSQDIPTFIEQDHGPRKLP